MEYQLLFLLVAVLIALLLFFVVWIDRGKDYRAKNNASGYRVRNTVPLKPTRQYDVSHRMPTIEVGAGSEPFLLEELAEDVETSDPPMPPEAVSAAGPEPEPEPVEAGEPDSDTPASGSGDSAWTRRAAAEKFTMQRFLKLKKENATEEDEADDFAQGKAFLGAGRDSLLAVGAFIVCLVASEGGERIVALAIAIFFGWKAVRQFKQFRQGG